MTHKVVCDLTIFFLAFASITNSVGLILLSKRVVKMEGR